jgi:hypothetical protein
MSHVHAGRDAAFVSEPAVHTSWSGGEKWAQSTSSNGIIDVVMVAMGVTSTCKLWHVELS